MAWPALLQQLTFGFAFNRPIEGMAWPASLQQLTFGELFDNPIEDVTWPNSLQKMTFGTRFDQPIEDVAWPASLRRLAFGQWFNRPFEGVAWPASLHQLEFGSWFDQPLEGVAWPASLLQVRFGGKINKDVFKQVDWPASVQKVTTAEFRLLRKGDGVSAGLEETLAASVLGSINADCPLPPPSLASEVAKPVTSEHTAPVCQTSEIPAKPRHELMASAVARDSPGVPEVTRCVVCGLEADASPERAEAAVDWMDWEGTDDAIGGGTMLGVGEAIGRRGVATMGVSGSGERKMMGLELQDSAPVSPAHPEEGMRDGIGGIGVVGEEEEGKQEEECVGKEEPARSMEGKAASKGERQTLVDSARLEEEVRDVTGGVGIVRKEKEEERKQEEKYVGEEERARSMDGEAVWEGEFGAPMSPARPEEGVRDGTGVVGVVDEEEEEGKQEEECVGEEESTRSTEGEVVSEKECRAPVSVARPEEGAWDDTGSVDVVVEEEKEEEDGEEEARNQEPAADRGRRSWGRRIFEAAMVAVLAIGGGMVSRGGRCAYDKSGKSASGR